MDDYQEISNGLPNTILLAFASGLSVLGSLTIITTYALYKDIRTVSRHIVVCISIADLIVTLFNCLALIISPEVNSRVSNFDFVTCKIQSFISTTAVLSSFLWTMVLAIYLLCVVVKGSKRLGKRIVWPWAHLLCWLIPLAINMIALFLGKLGNSGDRNTSGWCWINVFSNALEDAKLWMFIDGKAIEILTYFVILFIYIRIKLFIKTKLPSYDQKPDDSTTHLLRRHKIEAAKELNRKLIFIPLLFILLRVWGTIRFFVFLHTSDSLSDNMQRVGNVEKLLIYLQTVGDNLQGAVNCILFCVISPAVRKRIGQTMLNLRREKFHLHDPNVGANDADEDVSPFSS